MYEYMTPEQKEYYIEMKKQFFEVITLEYRLSLCRNKQNYISDYNKYLIEVEKYNIMIQFYNQHYKGDKNLHKPVDPKYRTEDKIKKIPSLGGQRALF